MSIENTEASLEVLDGSFDQTEKVSKATWNGRLISIGNINNHNPNINLCGAYLWSVYQNPKPVSPFWGYFDSEAKKKNEFDIAVYQYHIDEVHFVTWHDDYKRNTDELNTILSPWTPLDTSSFELMDKQYERKTLDPTFNPWTYA